MERLMLSVCMITKNEARWIGDCLRHLKDLADEVTIVDTGSTDTTKDIARSLGARVIESEWNDDFSQARNLSLNDARQPWILIIDPDERLAAKDRARIKSLCLDKSNVKAFAFQTRNYVRGPSSSAIYECQGDYEEERDYTHYSLSCKIRLFKNFLGIRWKGLVHETVNESVIGICKPGEFEESDIPFHHYGADPIIRSEKAKHQLYYRLTAKKIEQEPNNPDAYIEYAKERMGSGEIELALSAFRKAYELDPSSPYYRQQWVDVCKRYPAVLVGR